MYSHIIYHCNIELNKLEKIVTFIIDYWIVGLYLHAIVKMEFNRSSDCNTNQRVIALLHTFINRFSLLRICTVEWECWTLESSLFFRFFLPQFPRSMNFRYSLLKHGASDMIWEDHVLLRKGLRRTCVARIKKEPLFGNDDTKIRVILSIAREKLLH